LPSRKSLDKPKTARRTTELEPSSDCPVAEWAKQERYRTASNAASKIMLEIPQKKPWQRGQDRYFRVRDLD
jgi:hypothetical protein